MLEHQTFIGLPYLAHQKQPENIKNVLVNAVDFG